MLSATTGSSTIMTRSWRSAAGTARKVAGAVFISLELFCRFVSDDERRLTRGRLDQPDFLEFGFDDVLVERLHDVFVGAGVQRPGDMGDVVLGGAEHHLGPVAAGQPAQRARRAAKVKVGRAFLRRA